MHILEPDDAAVQAGWRALWEKSPQRSPFSALAYAEAVRDALGIPFRLATVADASPEGAEKGATGPWSAGVIAFERRQGPYRSVVIPPFTPYTPFVLAGTPHEASIHTRTSPFEDLLDLLERRYHRLQFHLHPSMQDVRAMRWRAWTATPLYTYRMPLSGQEDFVSRWSKSARYIFRQARAGFRVEEDGQAVRSVADLCTASYARHARSLPVAAHKLVHLVEALQRKGLARVFTATPKERTAPAGGLFVLHDGRHASYWIAGSEPGPAMTVLVGEALPRLHAEGVETLDFVGANTPSIAEFKRKFGGTLSPFYRIEKITRPELRLLRCVIEAATQKR